VHRDYCIDFGTLGGKVGRRNTIGVGINVNESSTMAGGLDGLEYDGAAIEGHTNR
jgi:hypothetical protein